MKYYLLNATINKDLGEYASEDEALQVVRALIDRFGEEHADDLVLASEDEDDDRAWTGAELVQRARQGDRAGVDTAERDGLLVGGATVESGKRGESTAKPRR